MTCIVGIAEKGRVWIGGDSAGVGGWSLRVRADEKTFRNGEYLYGFTSSFRMGDLLRYAFKPPERAEGLTDREFLCTTWMDAVRACFTAGGFKKKENEVESGGTFLLGYRGHLYVIQDNFQVGQAADSIDAVGCGHDLAMGALYATRGQPAQKRIRTALEAAARYNAAVAGPFTIVSSGVSSQRKAR